MTPHAKTFQDYLWKIGVLATDQKVWRPVREVDLCQQHPERKSLHSQSDSKTEKIKSMKVSLRSLFFGDMNTKQVSLEGANEHFRLFSPRSVLLVHT